ncbi:hypothetical protein HK12_13130 [Acetobacter orientalis]|uniref:Uncharacterized protein n=1 Tax=Acetobacter orientalis TaxID=146474 RepID=A0A251ZY70_9PROT|nr:hypothetical protein HK12_13130 [Acetobacter orientalis]
MNWFYKCSRRGEFVAVFDHICIDLDCYKYESNPTIQYHDLGENYEILLKFCDDNNIPRPSNILSSAEGFICIIRLNVLFQHDAKDAFRPLTENC